MTDEQRLRRDMLQAHEQDDLAALPALYLVAAQLRESQDDIDAACFFYTHAYVYALDCGDREIADKARNRLQCHGRDK
ncbi:MAG: hypothetical protein HKP56_13535 [Anderseniella sp.]|nr:hypothetical protein [Anderseniella sp.]